MGKKKKFIEKSQSVTFHLVDKPHADPSGFDKDNVRVWHEPAYSKRREEQRACGIYFEDEYDYTKHLRDRFGAEQKRPEAEVPLWQVTEEGQFDDSISLKSGTSRGGKSVAFSEGDFPSLGCFDSALAAVENGTDYNVMSANSQDKPGPHWDPEVAAAMGDEFQDFCDDLEDDFVALAGGTMDEDYDEDFPELGAFDADCESDENDTIDNESLSKGGAREHDWKDVLAETEAEQDTHLLEERQRLMMERDNLEEKSQRTRFTEYSLTSSAVPRSECQTDLDNHFENMYGEYDDLEVGALDHEEIGGHIKLDNPAVLQVLGIDKEDVVCDAGIGEDVENRITIDDISLRRRDSASDVDSDDLFPEPAPKPEFDCESILSTYSNIYNRPKVIVAEKKVQLDQFGMPKLEKEYPERLPNPEEDEMDRLKWVPPNVRRREETKEETRARQKIQKEEQRLRRIEKKNNKIAFKMEEIRQQRSDINKQRSSGFKY